MRHPITKFVTPAEMAEIEDAADDVLAEYEDDWGWVTQVLDEAWGLLQEGVDEYEMEAWCLQQPREIARLAACAIYAAADDRQLYPWVEQ